MAAIDADELGRLFDQYAPALVLYARRRTPEPEDIVQDAFIRLAAQRSRPTDILAWLHRVVRNSAMNQTRSARNRTRHEQKSARPESWLQSHEDRLDAAQLEQRLKSLDVETYEIIVARFWGGLTFEQIAQLQGLSLTTVHRRYRDGLTQISPGEK